MTTDRWERVVALFEEALRYTGEERDRFLDEADDATPCLAVEYVVRAAAADQAQEKRAT